MVLEIKTNAKEVADSIGSIRNKIKKSQKVALKEVAILGKTIAKSLAPTKSGALKRGIFHKVFSDRAEVISIVHKSFPYNLWVNAESPYNKITFKSNSFQPFFRIPQSVRYGMPALAPSGNSIRWTGTRGYFTKTASLLRERYGKIFDIKMEKVLRGK